MDGRDDKGRFVPGHGVKGGRPRKSEEQSVVAALENEMPLTEFAHLLAICMRRGDSWAFKLYADHRIGLPIQKAEISGPNGGPVAVTEVPFDFDTYAKLFGCQTEGADGDGSPAPNGAGESVDSA